MKNAYPKTALRAIRENAGLTQAELAAEIRKPVSFVSRLEAGKRVVLTPKMALRICRVFNCSSKQIFSEDDGGDK